MKFLIKCYEMRDEVKVFKSRNIPMEDAERFNHYLARNCARVSQGMLPYQKKNFVSSHHSF